MTDTIAHLDMDQPMDTYMDMVVIIPDIEIRVIVHIFLLDTRSTVNVTAL